ncbi:bifunctional Endoplasmic reticulum oxidoreductin 1/ERO1-like superfamily [Babesia duncani]|uniref:Bifunctional Endoplasmic reticulum oxidoreductin 1/ERO1-like superfamily n=1 Tax=Babesia duncani TaxID=323732 RepID=A0AAD9UNT0_9APIC|nr:bifunctional Endoplasmic reticulum oxidoreductin 1/ERO1-like superfamily [Babesia duncani]
MLLEDAQLVHAKLIPILSALYFRVFKVNLDSKYGTSNGDFCQGDTDMTSSLLGRAFTTFTDNCDAPTIPKCYVGRCDVDDVPLHAQPQGLEHYVLRYAESAIQQDWDPVDLYGRVPLYNDILGIHQSKSTSPVFVDLLRNPPSYTGYKGAKDWRRIYEESCCSATLDVPCAQSERLYKLISGMQASITAWAAWNYQCTNTKQAYQLKSELPKYRSNTSFYNMNLGMHPDRLENLFYTFEAMLRATCTLRPFLMGFAQQLGNRHEYGELQTALFEFINAPYQICDGQTATSVNSLYHLEHPQLLEKVKNIADIIDLVECEKCRLHGKLKLAALQITIRALSGTESTQVLERNELVALVHALNYFAQSLIIVQRFKEWNKRSLVLWPLGVMVAVLALLVILYRRELVYAMFNCSLLDEFEEPPSPFNATQARCGEKVVY